MSEEQEQAFFRRMVREGDARNASPFDEARHLSPSNPQMETRKFSEYSHSLHPFETLQNRQ